MFFINFLDRTAISFAGPNGMTQDLGLTAAQFGFAAGIFFFGYIVLEIPSNLALHKFGARKWLARIMVSWGIVSLLFTWVSSATELYILRFLLGIAEAGFFPGAILFLSMWVPSRHRAKILALFYLAQPLTTVIGAPIASALIQVHGAFGLEGWRIMFFGVSVPAILVGIATWFYLPDRPNDAGWLTQDEKDWLNGELAKEDKVKAGGGHGRMTGAALKDGRVWLLSAIYFGLIYGLYALAFFLPTIIGGFEEKFGTKFDVFDKGLITAIPYLPGRHRAVLLEPRRQQARCPRLAHRHPGAGRRAQHSAGAVDELARGDDCRHHRHGVLDLLGAAELLVDPRPLPLGCRCCSRHRADQHDRQPRRLCRPIHHRRGTGCDGSFRDADVHRRRPDAGLRHPVVLDRRQDQGTCPDRLTMRGFRAGTHRRGDASRMLLPGLSGASPERPHRLIFSPATKVIFAPRRLPLPLLPRYGDAKHRRQT
ncbi:MFS transporter [Rhizobium sp. GN54]|uniref:MFS transporter n=1 Tax=Rhizobium sp. GN54 TaxID=2898150 RepID=UPI001E438F6D|nr:MFS transporter [Rhizobium sp. GN54]MCD2183197.1 MFS transporter [Rhizobium sp. GN54]